MANNRNDLSVLLFLISQIVLSTINGIHAIKTDIDPNVINLFSMTRNVNVSNAISTILSHNWTKNHECIIELNAIKKGLVNQEVWAMKCKLKMENLLFYYSIIMNVMCCVSSVVDSWGNLPSGFLNGNSFEPGSFSECFQIERNGKQYKTQYCIGKLLMINPKQKIKRYKQFVLNDFC